MRDQVLFGDCRASLRQMALAGVRVQTCVTSPPYYGLRDYGVEGQIGQEGTPEQYVASLVEVFRAVRDVLAEDATLWLNLGDSYCSRPNGSIGKESRLEGQFTGHTEFRRAHALRKRGVPSGLKHKDILGIPWRVAFALQADGWYLRQDIIWSKPNPMPESVQDRCTKAHEYLFLLSKGPTYYFDAEAIAEPLAPASLARLAQDVEAQAGSARVPGKTNGKMKAVGGHGGTRNRRSVWTVATKPYRGAHFATFPPALVEPCVLAGSRPGGVILDPFMGSGTTAEVAILTGRRFLGCEINEGYRGLQQDRIVAAYLKTLERAAA